MTEAVHTFDDSAAYERFMGRWSRAVAPRFLDWIAASPGMNWLDVGCGTGALAELILERCAPAAVRPRAEERRWHSRCGVRGTSGGPW